MRILGIDYGTKRIGIALSDPDAVFGQPHSVIKNSKNTEGVVINQIIEIIKINQVVEVVLGESKNFKGQDNVVMSAIRDFKTTIENALIASNLQTVPIIFEPEFLTSYQAEHFQGKNDLLDASSAALILQSYLDRKNDQKNK